MTDATQKVAKNLQDAAYKAGLCIDCQLVKHSAGRTRCNPCHQRNNPSYEPQADRSNYPCRLCGQQPTQPGWLTCRSCSKTRGSTR